MSFLLSSSSLFMKPRSIKFSIRLLIIRGSAVNIVIYEMIASVSLLNVSTLRAFMLRTATESMIC